MAKIAVIIADLFEDSEYTEPVAAFRKAGHGIVHVGLRAGQVVRGKKEGTEVAVGATPRQHPVDFYDAPAHSGRLFPRQAQGGR
jgi:protease I